MIDIPEDRAGEEETGVADESPIWFARFFLSSGASNPKLGFFLLPQEKMAIFHWNAGLS